MSSEAEPQWLGVELALTIHDRQLAEHGGGVGVRDSALRESALSRPLNLWNYGEPDAADLAASYAYGVARNHPFIAGNKRTAWVLARLFLTLNGHELRFSQPDAIRIMLDLAAGQCDEVALAAWFRARLIEGA